MARFILYLQAIASTLVEIATSRSGRKEGKLASEQIEFLDEERVLTIAMLADAGDEALRLARFYDTGSHDPAESLATHQEFRQKIDFLYTQGRCFEFGYCKVALHLLRSEYSLAHRGLHTFLGGGVPDEVRARCLARMRAWVYLATSTIQAEFPRWDATLCMSIFNLQDARADGQNGRIRELNIRRLAHILSLPSEEFHAELDNVISAAHAIKSDGKGMSNAEAWTEAVERATARATSFGPLHHLRAALVRVNCWQGSTTSKVEQTFSRVDFMGS